MMIVSLAKAKAKLRSYIKAALRPGCGAKNSGATAVLLAVADDDELDRFLLSHSSELRRILQKSEKTIRSWRELSHEDFRAEMAE